MLRECEGREPEPTPAGRPRGEGQDGPSQCEGRMPEPTPAGRPRGEGQDGPSQCEGREPEPTPAGAPQGRAPRMGERHLSSLDRILADARVWKLKDASAAPARPVWST